MVKAKKLGTRVLTSTMAILSKDRRLAKVNFSLMEAGMKVISLKEICMVKVNTTLPILKGLLKVSLYKMRSLELVDLLVSTDLFTKVSSEMD